MRLRVLLALLLAFPSVSLAAGGVPTRPGQIAPPLAFLLGDYWYRVWPMRVFGTDQTGKITAGQLQGWTQTTGAGSITSTDAADGSWQQLTGANTSTRTYHTGTNPFLSSSTRTIATGRFYMTAAAAANGVATFFGFCNTTAWTGGSPVTNGCSQYCGVFRNTSGVLKWVGSDGSGGTISPLDGAGNTADLTLQATLPNSETHDFAIELDGDSSSMNCNLYMDGVLRTTPSVNDVALDGGTATLLGLSFKSTDANVTWNTLGLGFFQRRY